MSCPRSSEPKMNCLFLLCVCLLATGTGALQVKKRGNAFSTITCVQKWQLHNYFVFAFNASVPGFQQLCRKSSIQIGNASNSTVQDSCNMPYVWSTGELASFGILNTTTPVGDVTVPTSLIVNNPFAPLLTFIAPSTDPLAEIGFLNRSPGSLQLGRFKVGINVQSIRVTFTFTSTADCNQFVVNMDTDCSASHTCTGALPSVRIEVTANLPNRAGRCAINNFADLSFDQGFAETS